MWKKFCKNNVLKYVIEYSTTIYIVHIREELESYTYIRVRTGTCTGKNGLLLCLSIVFTRIAS